MIKMSRDALPKDASPSCRLCSVGQCKRYELRTRRIRVTDSKRGCTRGGGRGSKYQADGAEAPAASVLPQPLPV